MVGPASDDEGPDPVAVRLTILRGRGPPSGAQLAPYVWKDVAARPPPGRLRHAAYAVYHGTEIARDDRIQYTSVVEVDRDSGTLVDEGIGVERRSLLELMDRERRFVARIEARGRAYLATRSAHHRARAERSGTKWARRGLASMARVEARIGTGVFRGLRATTRAILAVPDRAVTSALRVQAQLADRVGRRLLRRGITDPGALNGEQKGVMLALALAVFLVALFVTNALFIFALPQHAVAYRSVLIDAGMGFLGVLFLPIPTEPFVIASTLVWGPVLGFLGVFVGKLAGSWVIYVLGDSLHGALDRSTAKRPRLKRLVEAIQRSADKSGFVLLLLVNLIPVAPDVLVYAFAVSGMRFRSFMGAVALGTALKFVAIIVALHVIGPERVVDFLGSPFG